MDPQPTTIASLPNEVLLNVFELLDAENLKTCALVCKKWNGMIGSSAAVMEKFKLNFHPHYARWKHNYSRKARREQCEEAGTLNRNFQNLNVDSDYIRSNKLFKYELDTLTRFGSSVKDLQVSYVKNFNILPSFRNLQRLYLSNVSCGVSGGSVQLDDLQYLRLYDVSATLLGAVNAPNLKEVEISGMSDDCADDTARTALVNFLNGSKKITQATFHDKSAELIFSGETQDQRFEFKLTKYKHLTAGINENLSKFLKSQAGSLRDLEIRTHSTESHPQLIETIYNSLKLNSLTILGDLMNGDWNKVKSNEHLKEIEFIDNSVMNPESFAQFLQKTPNLESLRSSSYRCSLSDNIEQIASTLTNLKHLQTVEFKPAAKNALFQKLQTLQVNEIHNLEVLKKFLDNNSTVEVLEVRYCFNLEIRKNIAEAVAESNLKKLTLGRKVINISEGPPTKKPKLF